MYNLETNFINQDRFPKKPTLPERLQRKAEKGLKVVGHLTKRAGEKLANGKEAFQRADKVFTERMEKVNLQNFGQKIPEAVGKMYEVAIDPTKPLPGQKTFNAGGAIESLPNAKKVEGSISDTAFSSITTELDRILNNFEQRANINSELSPGMLPQQTMGEICFQLKIDYVPIQMRRAIKLAFEQVNVEFIQRNNINNQDASRMSNREIVSGLLLQTLGEYVKGTKVVANDRVTDHNAALQRNIKFGHLINREGGSIGGRDKANDVGATQELTVASIIAGWKGLVSDQAEYREGDLENRQNLNSNRPQFKPQPMPPTPPTPEELAQLALVKAENLKKLGNLESEVLDLSQAEDVSDSETQELNYLDEDTITNKLGRLNDPNITEDDFKYIISDLPTKADLYKVIRDFKNLVQTDSVTNPEVISWLMDAANERKNINSRDLLVQEGDLAPLNIESEQEIKTVEVYDPISNFETAQLNFNNYLADYKKLKDADNSDPALNKKAPELQKSADGMYNALCKPVLVQIIEDSLHEWSNNDIFLLLQYYKFNKQNEPGYENFITNFVEILADLAPKREREVASLEQIISGQSGTVITEELPNTNPVEQSRENKDVAKIVSLVQRLPSADIVVGGDQVLRITSSVENNNTEVKLVITGNKSTTITFNHTSKAQEMSVTINNQIGSIQTGGTQSFTINAVQKMFSSLANSIDKPVDLKGVIDSLKEGLSKSVSEVTTNPSEQSQETQNNQKLNAEINRYLLDLNEEGGTYGLNNLVKELEAIALDSESNLILLKKLNDRIGYLYAGDSKIAKNPHLGKLQEVRKAIKSQSDLLVWNAPVSQILVVAKEFQKLLVDLQSEINSPQAPIPLIVPVTPVAQIFPNLEEPILVISEGEVSEGEEVVESVVEESAHFSEIQVEQVNDDKVPQLKLLDDLLSEGAKSLEAVGELLRNYQLQKLGSEDLSPEQKTKLERVLADIENNSDYSTLITENSEQFNHLNELAISDKDKEIIERGKESLSHLRGKLVELGLVEGLNELTIGNTKLTLIDSLSPRFGSWTLDITDKNLSSQEALAQGKRLFYSFSTGELILYQNGLFNLNNPTNLNKEEDFKKFVDELVSSLSQADENVTIPDPEVVTEPFIPETQANNAEIEGRKIAEKLSGMINNMSIKSDKSVSFTDIPAIKSFFEGVEWLNLIKVDLVSARIDYAKLKLFLTNLESSPQLKDVINNSEYTDGIEHLRSLVDIVSQPPVENQVETTQEEVEEETASKIERPVLRNAGAETRQPIIPEVVEAEVPDTSPKASEIPNSEVFQSSLQNRIIENMKRLGLGNDSNELALDINGGKKICLKLEIKKYGWFLSFQDPNNVFSTDKQLGCSSNGQFYSNFKDQNDIKTQNISDEEASKQVDMVFDYLNDFNKNNASDSTPTDVNESVIDISAITVDESNEDTQETNEQRLDRLSAKATGYFDNILTVDGVEYEGFYRLSEDIKAMTATDEALEDALDDDKLVPLLKNFQVLLDLMADSSDTEFQDISKDASLKLDEFMDEAKTNSYKGSILQEAINIMNNGLVALEKKSFRL